MPLLNGMRGTVRNVKATMNAVSSGTVASPRKNLPTKPTIRPPLTSPSAGRGTELSTGAPHCSEAKRLVAVHLYACSKLVMMQPTPRADADTDSMAKGYL